MPQAARKRTTGARAENTESHLASQSERKAKRKAYLLTALVAAVVLLIVGIFYYQVYVAPFRQVIITVDGTSIRMDYFITRTKMAGTEPVAMLQQLTNELIIIEEAPKVGIVVSAQDIDRELRSMAAGGNEQVSENAFKEWYRQQLNQTQVSDTTYREVVENRLLADRLQEYQAQRIATVVPQAHVNAIFVSSEDAAKKVVARWKSGEAFAQLAREVSTDAASREKGGDLGWMPRGVSIFDATAFTLDVGKISDAFPYMTDPNSAPSFYYVLLITEKADARQVDEQYLPMLRDQALGVWLKTEMTRHKISWNFNSEINAWLISQLAKSQTTGDQP